MKNSLLALAAAGTTLAAPLDKLQKRQQSNITAYPSPESTAYTGPVALPINSQIHARQLSNSVLVSQSLVDTPAIATTSEAPHILPHPIDDVSVALPASTIEVPSFLPRPTPDFTVARPTPSNVVPSFSRPTNDISIVPPSLTNEVPSFSPHPTELFSVALPEPTVRIPDTNIPTLRKRSSDSGYTEQTPLNPADTNLVNLFVRQLNLTDYNSTITIELPWFPTNPPINEPPHNTTILIVRRQGNSSVRVAPQSPPIYPGPQVPDDLTTATPNSESAPQPDELAPPTYQLLARQLDTAFQIAPKPLPGPPGIPEPIGPRPINGPSIPGPQKPEPAPFVPKPKPCVGCEFPQNPVVPAPIDPQLPRPKDQVNPPVEGPPPKDGGGGGWGEGW
ncbi:hypothetical protein M011DRAFT_348477 [Sporormia fimetaria CBS 119925]|uniref:Uncharacterized protein n=1 Tax=Sporormia fimetaria CBS 119925 TaxID=1340428 RepID=A0A6A6VDY7_9PLEO|nr:hypothetical protein M011DRAFT_348477 [Sporormia fimetaria CBS 119925]